MSAEARRPRRASRSAGRLGVSVSGFNAGRGAALDTASARRLCAAPDSVLAGRAPCVLRDQGVRPPVRPRPQP